MTSQRQVRAWRDMSTAAQLAFPGWWSRLDDWLRHVKGRHSTPLARVAVMSHVAASHESVPAMADMLERAAALLEVAEARAASEALAGEATAERDAERRRWLAEWHGD